MVDAEAIRDGCQDGTLARYLPSLPRPYTLADAEFFVGRVVTDGWATGSELTWAIRLPGDGLIGVIALRRITDDDVGFWLDARHRGNGHLPEALAAVLGWAFDPGNPLRMDAVGWECIVGNTASAAVARRCGFTFEGTGPGRRPLADGEHPLSWLGHIRADDSREQKPGWPA